MLSETFLAEARRWVAINTVTTRSNGALVLRAGRLLRSLGFGVRRLKTVEGGIPFFNLLARRGPVVGRPLLLNTHTDTVPSGPVDRWTSTDGNPFSLTRRGEFLHGLGVADVKLALLCQIEALRRLGKNPFRRPVTIAATYGEERGLVGARRLIRAWRGPKPAVVVDSEPSEMALIHRHRGYLVFDWILPESPLLRGRGAPPCFEVVVRGESAHSSTPQLGVNALERGVALLNALSRRGFSPRVIAAGGGTAHNQVPAEARFTFFLPGWPAGFSFKGVSVQKKSISLRRPLPVLPWEVFARLKTFAASLPPTHTLNWALLGREKERWVARFDLRFPPEDSARRLVPAVERALAGAGVLTVRLDDPPMNASPSGSAVRLVTKALRRAGLPATLKEKPTCTEAGLYDAWGAPAVVVGPGRSLGNIHRPNERIALSQLEKAVHFYEELFRLWTTT